MLNSRKIRMDWHHPINNSRAKTPMRISNLSTLCWAALPTRTLPIHGTVMALAVLFLNGAPAQAAGLVMSISNSSISAAPGSTGSFEILLSDTDTAGSTPFYIASDFVDLTSSNSLVKFTGASITTSIDPYIFAGQSLVGNSGLGFTFVINPSTMPLPGTEIQTQDSAYSANPPAVYATLKPGEVLSLGVFSYSVSASAAPGASSDVKIGILSQLTDNNTNNPANINFTTQNATITVSSAGTVPEPSTALMGMIALTMGVVAARCRRRA